MAKGSGAPYRPGQRTGMVKVKRLRTIDAVVVGYRPGKEDGTVGSLILGLYDQASSCTSSGTPPACSAAEKRALVGRLGAVRDRARAATATRAGGRARRSSSGSSSAPSWSSRSPSTTRAAGASATARRSCAGATTNRREECRLEQMRGVAGRPVPPVRDPRDGPDRARLVQGDVQAPRRSPPRSARRARGGGSARSTLPGRRRGRGDAGGAAAGALGGEPGRSATWIQIRSGRPVEAAFGLCRVERAGRGPRRRDGRRRAGWAVGPGVSATRSRASTYGTGELIMAALHAGRRGGLPGRGWERDHRRRLGRAEGDRRAGGLGGARVDRSVRRPDPVRGRRAGFRPQKGARPEEVGRLSGG